MIEMDLAKIMLRDNGDDQYVFLRERTGKRSFPIVIGPPEAREIYRLVSDMKTPRPMTHELLRNAIEAMGGTLERVVVNDLDKGTFFARIVVSRNGEPIELDARPSDAIALATRARIPIFAAEHVVDLASS
ncbi:MAG TPA: bifunctional nuclease family protein [Planctomycetota bacterium]|nr:bifunctional nuclease family protein [Planctomycetota bacterium]